MQHCRPVLAQTWRCSQQQTALNHSGISTFCSQQHGKGMELGRVDAPVMQQTFHLQQCWGWGFFLLQITVVESREDFFFSFLLHSHTDEQPHRSGSLARFAFPGSAAGCRIWDQSVRNGSAEAHGEGISLISPLPIFVAVMGRSLLPGAKPWELHPALHDASPRSTRCYRRCCSH